MDRVLIIDNDTVHADRLNEILRPHGVMVDRVSDPEQGIRKLLRCAERYVLVIVTISDTRSPWWRILQKLKEACRNPNGWSAPLFLCVGRTPFRPEFILRIERLGTRYVRER
jgi:hypothetical protein